MRFYVYIWLRRDRTPYYVGKGSGNRAFNKNHGKLQPPRDLARVILLPQPNEQLAFSVERELIEFYGRKNIGTGLLRNECDGGNQPPSRKGIAFTPELRKIWSEAAKGRIKTQEHRENLRKAMTGRKPHQRTIAAVRIANRRRVISEKHKQQAVKNIARANAMKGNYVPK